MSLKSKLTSKDIDTLKEMYIDEIRDLYSAEKQIIDALPTMAKSASHSELSAAFEKHLQVTKEQKKRLEKILENHGKKADSETCKGMKGIISEGEEMVKEVEDSEVRDAALISAAQRVEHYEIAGYGTVRNWAERLGYQDDAQLLQKTLDEEGNTDHELTELATQLVNPSTLEA